MKQDRTLRTAPAITILLAILVSGVSLTGILGTGFYSKETANWQLQSIGQDQFDLYIVTPVLLLTGINPPRNKRASYLLWAGTLLYIIYTFTIYCFDVHFNRLFPVYCMILGLAIYSFALFLYQDIKPVVNGHTAKNKLLKIIAVYFISIATIFYVLWLSEIITAIANSVLPPSVVAAGLPTNPVQVIDLSVFLPAVFITGLLLLKRHPLATDFAAILLFFLVLMDASIAWLAIKMKQQDPSSSSLVAIGMIVLALLSGALLVLLLQKIGEKQSTVAPPPRKPVFHQTS